MSYDWGVNVFVTRQADHDSAHAIGDELKSAFKLAASVTALEHFVDRCNDTDRDVLAMGLLFMIDFCTADLSISDNLLPLLLRAKCISSLV